MLRIDIYLCNRETGEIFYEDFGFIYITLVNFVKEEAELENDFEGWLYILKNMTKLDKLPLYLRKPIFEKLFDVAAYSKMNKEDREMYDVSLKRKWDAYSYEESRVLFEERAVAKALEQGLQQGLQQGIAQMKQKADVEKLKSARKMMDKGFDLKLITELLSLTESEIDKLNR
ncbi:MULTISPECIES: Rpn family recombination-promoting nuclease/putative transposase [Sphingobacterium]|uniref:Rpn family recombination-promoting nuclease/putative transposase n=1 Tax=Sphingobacterium TaxID=28453 RepID=UPI001F09AAA8|nr:MULTISPECIES: Rpn family recombination-promoting nuclease/putative transposase [unclassified Sphingobacterium]